MMKLTRRHFLRGSGAAVALPMLDAMAGEGRDEKRRMVAICTNMGMLPRNWFPKGEGAGYRASPYLEILKDFRKDFTVFSGVSLPEVDGGHHAEISFLTGAPHPGRGGFRNTISLDQYAAERVGIRTRLPYLTMNVGVESRVGISWTGSGVMIPPERKASNVFKRLFVQGSKEEVAAQIERLREGRSVLDAVADRARELGRKIGPADRGKLDQYFDSVRELERRLVKAEEWEKKPKAKVSEKPPVDLNDPSALIEKSRLMFRLTQLALETDSTRIVTILVDENHNPKPNLEGVSRGHHILTHHGHRKEALAELRIIEEAQTRVFGELLGGLRAAREEGKPLLDRTMVLYGTNLGDGNNHKNTNLPVLLAGGGFRHGRHLAFDTGRNYPLTNLYVSMLQRLGIETDRFASSTGTMEGI